MTLGRLAAVTGLVLMTTACGDSGQGPEAVPSGEQPTMEEARAEVLEQTPLLVDALKELGLTPAFARGRYGQCTDDAAGFAYDVSGRLDLPGEPGDPLAASITGALEASGWTVDGQADRGERTIVNADQGHLRASVSEYSDQPFVLVEIAGPCLPVSEEEAERYRATDNDDLEL